MEDEFRPLILLGDVDELLREVDRRAERRDWPGLHRLRAACEAALDTGHQLWPVSSWISYVLVLRGEHDDVVEILAAEPPVFTLGPLTEVAAQRSTWAEIGERLLPGPVAAGFAGERVIRGDDLSASLDVDGETIEVPLRLADWEPTYRTATYSEAGCDVGVPDGFRPTGRLSTTAPDAATGDREGARALEVAVAHLASDDIAVRTSAVEGVFDDAISSVIGEPEVEVVAAEQEWVDALAELAWWASSGMRRSGAATGRVRTWWALAGMSGLIDDWPVTAEELGDALDDLAAHRFERADKTTLFGLAVDDRRHGLSWAVEVRRRPATNESR